MAKGHKTGGGSRKGKPNKATQDIRAAILSRGDLVAKGFELLECGDKKVEAAAWRTLMEYGYGKAVQPISGEDGSSAIRVLVEHIGTQDKAPAKAD